MASSNNEIYIANNTNYNMIFTKLTIVNVTNVYDSKITTFHSSYNINILFEQSQVIPVKGIANPGTDGNRLYGVQIEASPRSTNYDTGNPSLTTFVTQNQKTDLYDFIPRSETTNQGLR